jgi:hypothetical protein
MGLTAYYGILMDPLTLTFTYSVYPGPFGFLVVRPTRNVVFEILYNIQGLFCGIQCNSGA